MLLVASMAQGQVTFVDSAAPRGLTAIDPGPGYGAGAAAADYDDDGDIDLFLPGGQGVPDRLYRNDAGVFFEIGAAAGVASTASSRAGLFVDLTGDGLLDLVVAGDCWVGEQACFDAPSVRLLRQEKGGVFTDVTVEFGLADDVVTDGGQHRVGLVAGDLNGDGWLDLLTGLWQGPARVLMNNEGTGLIDIAPGNGMDTADLFHWQPAIYDFNRDGRCDVYWAVDYTENRMWINQGGGVFVDLAPQIGLDNAMNDMGMVLGDVDNNGLLDIFVTEIFEDIKHNVLYLADGPPGTLSFSEVGLAAGVGNTGFGWGATMFDADHDGLLDIAATNGWFSGIGFNDRTKVLLNQGTDPLQFQDVTHAAGIDDRNWGVALISFDVERDGDLDLLQTCNLGIGPRIYENLGDPKDRSRRWLVVRPRMPGGTNVRAIGAVVRARAGELSMMRLIHCGTSHLGQEPAEAHFGLAGAQVVDEIRIEWPDGAQTIRRHVAANQLITIERSPCAGSVDLDGDGDVDVADMLVMFGAWGPTPIKRAEDIDGNGQVGVSDLLELFGAWGVCAGG